MKLTVLAAILIISFAPSDANHRKVKKLLEGLAELALPGAFWLKTADLINNFYGGPFGYANALKSDLNNKLSGLSHFDLFSNKFAKFGLSSSLGHWPAETEDWPCETTENWPAAAEVATDNHQGLEYNANNHHGLEYNAQVDLGHAATESVHHVPQHHAGSKDLQAALRRLQASASSDHHVSLHHTGSALHRLSGSARLTASHHTTNHHADNHHAGSNVNLLASLTRLAEAQRHH